MRGSHDLGTTTAATDLLPWLLLLALLLWPLDVAVRRVSRLARRPCAGPRVERRPLAVVARPGATHRAGRRDARRQEPRRRRPDAGGAAHADTAARTDAATDDPTADSAARLRRHLSPAAQHRLPGYRAPTPASPDRPSRPTRWPGYARRSSAPATVAEP